MQLWVGTEIPLQIVEDRKKLVNFLFPFKFQTLCMLHHCFISILQPATRPHLQFATGYHRIGRCFVVSAALPEAVSHNLATGTSACPCGHWERGKTEKGIWLHCERHTQKYTYYYYY